MNWRTVTILLVIANLFFWAWNSWIAQPEIVGLEDHRINRVPQLSIVGSEELEKQRLNNLTSSLEESVSAGINTDLVPAAARTRLSSRSFRLVCRRIGNYSKEEHAIAAEKYFIDEGINVVRKVGQEKVWLGHWVYLPKYPSREAASQVVQALRAKGDKDNFIEIVPPYVNTISLGLFKQRSGAESRSSQIQALGYPTRIGVKEGEEQVFWLEIEGESNREIPMDRLVPQSAAVQRVKIRECIG